MAVQTQNRLRWPDHVHWRDEFRKTFEVRQRFFPQWRPSIPGIDYAGVCRPALGVSGDCYDFLHLGPHRLGLLLADVSGKGMPAALLGAALHTAVRAYAPAFDPDCGEVLARVNRLFFEATAPQRFATVFYGVYDARTRTLTYANAGHYPPFLIQGNGECVRLHSLTPPVGILPVLPAEERSIQLAEGDRLVILSDGIPEACDAASRQFGDDRLVQFLDRQRTATASELCGRLLSAVLTFSRGRRQADDLTLIAAQVADPAGCPS
jgi:sigma-B regulation protein RsbU (phosphoserine phosphatase)